MYVAERNTSVHHLYKCHIFVLCGHMVIQMSFDVSDYSNLKSHSNLILLFS